MVSDSAGIRIITSYAAAWRPQDAWTVSAQPLVSIGSRGGDPQYQLYAVYDAARLSDGRIVVGDNGSRELRFYDTEGRFIGSVGRHGAGPGEFRFILSIEAADDSLWVFDGQLQRLSIFDGSGRFARSLAVEADQLWRLGGRFADGDLLVIASTAVVGLDRPGVVHDSSLYVPAGADGAVLDSIARLPDGERYVRADGDQRLVIEYAFARSPTAIVCGNHFIYGSADSYELRVYSADGRLVGLIRRPNISHPVTPEDIHRYIESRVAATQERFRAATRRALEEMPFPETMPAYARILADEAGNLWVEEYRPPGGTVPRWSVFGPAGRWLGDVTLPERFRLLQAGTDFVLGVWRDDLDVEYIRIHRLLKPSGGVASPEEALWSCAGAA